MLHLKKLDKRKRTSCVFSLLGMSNARVLRTHKVEKCPKLHISRFRWQIFIPASQGTEGRDGTAVKTRDAAPGMADEESELKFLNYASW